MGNNKNKSKKENNHHRLNLIKFPLAEKNMGKPLPTLEDLKDSEKQEFFSFDDKKDEH